jgi:hypothetical protein
VSPAGAMDAVRLGLRRMAHWAPDARTLYQMPEPASRITQGELLGSTQEELESQARTPAGAANVVRPAPRFGRRLALTGIVGPGKANTAWSGGVG